MSDTKLKRELYQAKNKRPSDFWGYAIALLSLGYGHFIYVFNGYLIAHAQPYLKHLPEKWIGVFLIVAALLKLLGLATQTKLLKKWSIWLLSALWGGLFFVSVTYSFGVGYPDPSYLFNLFILVACLRVSLKGNYEHER